MSSSRGPSAKNRPVAVVLAAGKSTRMKSDLPKVLHELCGQPILSYVLDALHEAGIDRRLLVVGFGADLVREQFGDQPGVEFVHQAEQKGTGHAVMVCQEELGHHQGPVLLLAGDGPMVRAEMLKAMLDRFAESKAKALLATAVVSDPFGFGRIIRDSAGNFERIVEQKDGTPAELAIREINPSFYVFDGPTLFETLQHLKPNNAQGEYYVTDVPGIMRENGHLVLAENLATEVDIFGINHRRHLAQAHVLMQDRIQGRHLDAGVTIVDARNTYIDARAKIGRDTMILPFSVIGGPVEIGAGCQIGPFAHLRAGTVLADNVTVGAFVEVVRSQIGSGTIARHLSFLGDAVLGEGVNVGAGLITANFDGESKRGIRVDDGAFLGSGAVLIAPVNIGSKAMVGAGAIVTKHHHVPPSSTVVGVPARPLVERDEIDR